MNETYTKRDLVSDPKASWLVWGVPITVILATGYFSDGGWIMTVGWTASLAAMGIACAVNARRCGRTHCYFTGPFFLVMAVVSVLHGLHVISLGQRGWSYIGAVLLLGGIGLCMIPELVWGRYRK